MTTYTFEEIRHAKRVLADLEAFELYNQMKEAESKGFTEQSRIVGVEELARIFDVSKGSIHNWRDQGEESLPHEEGRKHKFDVAKAWRWMKAYKANIVVKMDKDRRRYIESLCNS